MSPERADLDTTLTSRYECKYLVGPGIVQAIRHRLSAYAQLDHFSAHSTRNRSYRVYSLYFDTAGLRLYQDTCQGRRNRYKLRLRYYDAKGEGPVFFEVKKRSDQIVRKAREQVQRHHAVDFLRNGGFSSAVQPGSDLAEFIDRCRETGARPAVRVRYFREAWESRGIDPVRVTFDTGLEHSVISDLVLEESRPQWQATPLDGTVLEIKFTERKPTWVDQLISHFQLNKISVAKYALSVDRVKELGRFDALQAKIAMTGFWQNAGQAG